MSKTTKYPKVFIGWNHYNQRIYLSPPSWDCDWYWGFGYLGNSTCHYHVDGLKNPQKYNSEKKCWESKRLNLYDGFKEEFGDTLRIEEKDLWVLCELFETFYRLKAAAELYKHGGANYVSNPPTKSVVQNLAENKRINEEVLPVIFEEIYKILTPTIGLGPAKSQK